MQLGSQPVRKACKQSFEIDGIAAIPGGGHRHHVCKRPKQACQPGRRQERDLGALSGELRKEARKLDGVAEPLLGLDQDALAPERLAGPGGELGDGTRRGIAGGQEPVFVIRPAFGEPAGAQIQDAAIEVRVGKIRLHRQRPLIAGQSLVEAFQLGERIAEVVAGLGIAGPQLDRLAEGRNGRLESSLVGERVAEVVIGIGIIRPQPQRLAIRRNRLVQSALGPQHDAKIAVDAGVVASDR